MVGYIFALCMSITVMLPALNAEEPWPGEPEAGLLWVWGSALAAEQIFDADGEWLRDSEFRLRALARPDHHFAAIVTGGALEAIDLAPVLSEQWSIQQRLALELALHPLPAAGDGALWVVAGKAGPLFAMALRDGRLVAEVVGVATELGPGQETDSHHLAIELVGSELRWWRNGEAQETVSLSAVPDLAAAERVSFGGHVDGSDSWSGTLEGLLVASAARSPAASTQYWRSQWAQREALPISRVRARLVAHAREPAAADLLEYDECLLAMVWAIEEQISGPAIAAGEMLTWHWYQLDRRVLQRARPPALDSVWVLELSPIADNPQTSGVQMVETDLEPDQVFALDAFLLHGEPEAP
ncbi:MAG: hypothetical protein EA402_05045 [Planctomycetota bacterium]|nr:MAG: hypothetical protein EA402_05045 [Planctomycetota bacterium]